MSAVIHSNMEVKSLHIFLTFSFAVHFSEASHLISSAIHDPRYQPSNQMKKIRKLDRTARLITFRSLKNFTSRGSFEFEDWDTNHTLTVAFTLFLGFSSRQSMHSYTDVITSPSRNVTAAVLPEISCSARTILLTILVFFLLIDKINCCTLSQKRSPERPLV